MTEVPPHTPGGEPFTVVPGEHDENTKHIYGPDGTVVATETTITWPDGTFVTDRLDYHPDGTVVRSGHTRHTDGTHSYTHYEPNGTVTTEHPMPNGELFKVIVHPDGSQTAQHSLEFSNDGAFGYIQETTELNPDGTVASTHEFVQSKSHLTGEQTNISTTKRPDGYHEVTTVVRDRDGNELRRTHEVFDPANPPPPPPVEVPSGGGDGGFDFKPNTRVTVATRGGSGGWTGGGGGGFEHVLDWYWVTEGGESTYLFTTPKVLAEDDDND